MGTLKQYATYFLVLFQTIPKFGHQAFFIKLMHVMLARLTK